MQDNRASAIEYENSDFIANCLEPEIDFPSVFNGSHLNLKQEFSFTSQFMFSEVET